MKNDEILLFSYFKGHGDGLHLAWSEDGIQWSALNDDRILLKGEVGKEKIMRDPCLIHGQDGIFHLVWTAGWTEKGIGYTSSWDLIHWSLQRFLPVMEHEEHARNCWAPEIFFDRVAGHYLVYWSSTIDGRFPETQPFGDDGYNHRIYYTVTREFRNFSETRLLYDKGFNVIDANIVRNGDGYLMFLKDETLIPPAKNIRMAVGRNPYEFGPPGQPLTTGQYWAEGPSAIRYREEWIVYFDKYRMNQIGAIRSTDLMEWEDISHLLEFPSGAQHGFVLSVPGSRVQDLIGTVHR